MSFIATFTMCGRFQCFSGLLNSEQLHYCLIVLVDCLSTMLPKGLLVQLSLSLLPQC